MTPRTPSDELIEQAMEVLPRFRRSLFRHAGGSQHHHAQRGRPNGARGQGRKGRPGRDKRGRGGPAQMRIVMQLYRQGPAKISDIADWTGISLPTASEQIDGLVDAGMAERKINPEDRREVLVELTPKAMELADYFWNLQRARVEQVFARFSPEEQPLVVRILEAFAEVFEQDPAEFDDDKPEVDA